MAFAKACIWDLYRYNNGLLLNDETFGMNRFTHVYVSGLPE